MQVQAGNEAAAAAEEPNTLMSTIVRGLLMYFVFSMFLKRGDPADATQPTDGAIDSSADGANAEQQLAQPGKKSKPYSNFFDLGQEMNLFVFLSSSEDDYAVEDQIWQEESIFYDWQEENSRSTNVTISLTEKWSAAQQNGSLYAHVYLARPPDIPSPKSACQAQYRCVYGVQQLNRYVQQPKIDKRKSLLGYDIGDTADQDAPPEASAGAPGENPAAVAVGSADSGAAAAERPIVSLWKPKLT